MNRMMVKMAKEVKMSLLKKIPMDVALFIQT